ncbi:MAG TPA: GDP-L-fucose synthase [Puia sp.]
MQTQDKIFVAGHRGMVGSAIIRRLQKEGFTNLVGRSSAELDLRNQAAVRSFFETVRPDYVFLAAAKVGGIMANTLYRGEFLYDNLMIQANVIDAAYRSGVRKLLFIGSAGVYPRLAPQPLKEEYLLTGLLEPTIEPYAVAKIAGIKLCDMYRSQYGCNFISVLPINLYGPNDHYDPNNSHVLPAMIRKFHEAKVNNDPSVTLWGSGKARREFLHADDLADGCLFLMREYNDAGPINIGTGEDTAIGELALLVKKIVGYTGEIKQDLDKPEGAPRKLMDVGRLQGLGWKASIGLENGLREVYAEYAKGH